MGQSTPGRSSARQCLRPDRRKRADVVAASAHLPAVLIGLRWLYDTVQPPQSAIDPRGHSLPSARGSRSLRFDPVGRYGLAVVEIFGSARSESGDGALATAEIAAFGDLVDGLGEEVIATWTGTGNVIGGLALARSAHPSLLAAVARFREHGLAEMEDAIDLRAVQCAVLDRALSLQPFVGPWPESLDPSGVLRRLAGGAVAKFSSGQGGVGRR
ncbi:hypothetical protein ABIA30_004317 [Mycobacterium sp. MAA66]